MQIPRGVWGIYMRCQLSRSALLLSVFVLLWVGGSSFARQDKGYQTIQGTQVYTVIDHDRGVATFSNDCGTQTLTSGPVAGRCHPH